MDDTLKISSPTSILERQRHNKNRMKGDTKNVTYRNFEERYYIK